MWEIESDRFTTDRLQCQICFDQNFKVILPCNKHTICKKCVQNPTITKKLSNKRPPEIEVTCPYCRCVGKGKCAENMEANDLLEFYRALRAKGGKECSLHVLHERLYSCQTCDNKELFCLMCFAEKHMGHIIFKSECITEDHLLNSSPTTSTVKPVSDRKFTPTPPTSEDDDFSSDYDEEYHEKEKCSKGKKRKTADHSVQIDSTSFSERDNTEELDGLCEDIYPEESRENDNRVRNKLERLTPKKSKKVKMEDWMNHYYALLSYGDENKDSEGKANYNVPNGYIYGKGEDEMALGDFVSKLNFKTLAEEKYDLLLPLITEGDFSILFGENEADSCNSKGNSTKDSSIDNQSCPADINTDSKVSIKQQKKGEGRQQKQEKQQPLQLQQEDNQYQQHSHHNQRINHDQQSLLQNPSSSSSYSSKVDDDYYYNNKSTSNNDNNVTNSDNYHIDNVTLWKGRPPLPSELELKSCILYIYREPDNEREYIRWGQIKEFNNDIYGCSNDTKILTRYVQPSNTENMEKCSYTIFDKEYFAIYKDILLWGLTLKAGKHSTSKKWCTTDDSKTKVAEFFRNNQKSKLTFKYD